jgi:hypothetical protein
MKAICPEFNCLTQRVHSTRFPLNKRKKGGRLPRGRAAGLSHGAREGFMAPPYAQQARRDDYGPYWEPVPRWDLCEF